MTAQCWTSSSIERLLDRLIKDLQKDLQEGKLPKDTSVETLITIILQGGGRWREILHDILGQFTADMLNLLIVGRSGVGKSTLVNAIFEDNFAKTGSSVPVTMETRKYTKKGVPLAIYDTRGLELKHCDRIINELVDFLKHKQKQRIDERIHVAWLCIAEGGQRVEEAEKELVQRLTELKIPVIAVITKAIADDKKFAEDVRKLLPEVKNVVSVLAIEKRLRGPHVTKGAYIR